MQKVWKADGCRFHICMQEIRMMKAAVIPCRYIIIIQETPERGMAVIRFQFHAAGVFRLRLENHIVAI